MKRKALCDIPLAEIRVTNPRTRGKMRFLAIVNSIESVGLKKPITVVKRAIAEDGTQYDLVCGQGRLEAFMELQQATIPANVIDATREDQYLMSLVENIARRPPSNKDLFREVIVLKQRGYTPKEIASKLGRDLDYISAINRLVAHDQADLAGAVEAKRLPITIALLIASSDDPGVQRALQEAYESGALRGARFKDAKRVIARCTAKRLQSGQRPAPRRLTGEALVREYQRRTREQRALVERAAQTREKLILLKSAMQKLLGDEHFCTLLRAERLQEVPAQLIENAA